jgi:hypothetical protein
MLPADVITPNELGLLIDPPGELRFTKLKTFVASPRNWKFRRSGVDPKIETGE